MSDKTYVVRTYGCQMNEHDSERIAGLLEADGLRPAAGVDDADVVVLNTCCIRENADNKLYGHLGQLKALKAARPDMQIVVGGCLAQKDRDLIVERAPHVDVVLGTHNVGRAAELLGEQRAAGRLDRRDPRGGGRRRPRLVPPALPARREVPYAGLGDDPDRVRQLVRLLHRARGAGTRDQPHFDDIVDEVRALAADGVTEVTLLGQNVNSYGRDLTLARAAGRARPCGCARCSPTCSGPSGRSRASAGCATPAPIPRTCGPRRSRPWPRRRRGVRAPAPAPPSGQRPVLAAMHRGYTAERYLERLAAARAAIADLAVTTDIIVGFPGETDDDFERTLEVVAEAAYDSAYTFIYSPAPGTEAAERVDDFVPAEVTPSASSGCGWWSSGRR